MCRSLVVGNASRRRERPARVGPFAVAVACALLLLGLLASATPATAQTPAAVRLDSLFFADNTEFRGPFRTGETVLGSLQRVVFEIRPGERATVQIGVYALERAGAPSTFEHVLPIVALRLGTPRQQFILGTLETGGRRDGFGPDRATPHDLLPPLAVETDWFARHYQAGLQWLTRTRRFTQDAWFNYQWGNTTTRREKFDAGIVGRAHIAGPLDVGYQVHVVHHGGQQHHNGPVSDSFAIGPGLVLEGRVGRVPKVSLELYGLASHDGPDRGTPERSIEGKAAFLRAAFQGRQWRAHVIMWRADEAHHEDGDPNYLSRFLDGVPFRPVRDYSETGFAWLFRPAPGVDLEASARLHRIESTFSYSYRVLATVHLTLWERQAGQPELPH
jgi:hypothetical protein